MAPADHDGLDLYGLLGVSRDASREEIAQAWRRRARAEHPDSRPADAAAPGRFRALAGAWEVLGDPDRRAAYDRAQERERPPAAPVRVRVQVRHAPGPGGPPGRVGEIPWTEPRPPLRAGPVWVEGPRQTPPAGHDAANARLAVLTELALQLLGRDRDWLW